jgi:hypothetical protein
VKSLNVKFSLTSTTMFILFAAPLLGFNSVMPTAASSSLSIDDTTISGNDTFSTFNSENLSSNASATSTNVTSAVELADEPFAVGRYRSTVSDNMTSETQVRFTFRGNTTITVPDSTETVNTTDRGGGSLTFHAGSDGIIRGQFRSTTPDRNENATVQITEFLRNDTFRGIGFAYFRTNSTGMLAPLNNMIAVFIDEEVPNGDSIVSFFELKAGAASMRNNNSTATGGGNYNTTMTTPDAYVIPTLYENT